MPFTDAGVYYPDATTDMSIADISQAVAESINDKLGVVNVVYGTTVTVVTNTSGTVFGNSGLKASITPNSTSNGVLVIVRMPFETSATGAFWSGANFQLRRGTTPIAVAAPGFQNINDQPNGSPLLNANTLSISYIDFPSTTNTTEYSVWGKMWNVSPTPSAQTLSMNYADGAALSTISLLEVAI